MTASVVLLAVLVSAAVLVLPLRETPVASGPADAPAPARPSTGRAADQATSTDAGGSRAEIAEVARLLAAALRAGVGVVEAIDEIARCGPVRCGPVLRRVAAGSRWGLAPDDAWASAPPAWAAVRASLVAAEGAGLSPVRALEAAADEIERDRAASLVEATRRLEAFVVLPLGLAFLPGFVLTTVVPVVVALARSLLAS